MSTSIKVDVNVVRHDNHISPVTLTKRTFTSPINTLLIYNTSATTAYISFDGTSLLSINGGGAFSMDFNKLYAYYTQGDGSTTALQVVTGSEY